MPVPKRKVSKARRDQRSANKNVSPKPFIYCPNAACKQEPLLPHMACPRCGFYRSRKVMSGEVDAQVAQAEETAAAASTQASHTEEAESSDAQQSSE